MVTVPGTQTLPEIRLKVMVTPETPVPALVATRPETLKAAAGSSGVTLLDGLDAGPGVTAPPRRPSTSAMTSRIKASLIWVLIVLR